MGVVTIHKIFVFILPRANTLELCFGAFPLAKGRSSLEKTMPPVGSWRDDGIETLQTISGPDAVPHYLSYKL